ncbi:MAG: hypothetical protein ACR2O0_01355 [Rhizobiaceae bacterium]
MYNPREAQEDFLIYTIFLFIAFIVIAFIFLNIAQQNGVTYLYLKFSGVETNAKVVDATPVQDDYWPGASNDREPLYTKYMFEYGGLDGLTFQNFLILPPEYIDGEKQPLYEIGELVEVVYSEEKPETFLPISILQGKRMDANILVISMLVIVGFSFLVCRKIAAYNRFRNRARYY